MIQKTQITSTLYFRYETKDFRPVVISKKFNKGSSRYNHAHILGVVQLQLRPYFQRWKHDNLFNTDIVQSTIRDPSITILQSTIDHSTLETRPINSEKLSQCKNFKGAEPPQNEQKF